MKHVSEKLQKFSLKSNENGGFTKKLTEIFGRC